VYQPLEALTDLERSLLECSAPSGFGTTPSARRAIGLIPSEESLEVYTKDVDGERFVAVAHTRLRALLALISFERTIPDAVVPAFFAKGEVRAARRELELFQQKHPDVRPTVVQSVWHVPPRWFVCFDDVERRVEQVGDHPTIRYETSLEIASARVGDALDTLTGEMVHPVIVGMIRELKEWLSGFHPRSLIELDYASVAELFDADALADDHSSADVWNSIRALGEGDGMRAGLFYQRVNERWASARQLESLN
jgi:hypothetical protein